MTCQNMFSLDESAENCHWPVIGILGPEVCIARTPVVKKNPENYVSV